MLWFPDLFLEYFSRWYICMSLPCVLVPFCKRHLRLEWLQRLLYLLKHLATRKLQDVPKPLIKGQEVISHQLCVEYNYYSFSNVMVSRLPYAGPLEWDQLLYICIHYYINGFADSTEDTSIFLAKQSNFHQPVSSHEPIHKDDVIMRAMASQTISLTIVNSSFYSRADQRKHQNSPVIDEFPAQGASNV